MISIICRAQAATCLVIMISATALAQYDVNTLKASSSRTAASYESGRSTGNRKGYTGPEGSGRPGVYFYKKGVSAFDKEQYPFAVQMYEVAAAWAYKPAQYNLSVMYSRGQGVAVDIPRAMAWITLAAERGDVSYISARKAINAELTSDQIAEANRILNELKPRYADATALRRASRRWRDVKLDATGSRLGYAGGLKVGAAGNHDASRSPGYVAYSAAEVTGGKQNDASIEYRQLQESNNPYDPKDLELTGIATIGEIEAIPDQDTANGSATEPAAELPKQ